MSVFIFSIFNLKMRFIACSLNRIGTCHVVPEVHFLICFSLCRMSLFVDDQRQI